MKNQNVYEKKVVDADFPIELFLAVRNEEGLYFSSHWHKEIEILCATEGEAKIVMNRREHILKEGSMIIINSNTLHSGYCLKTPYKCRVISFNPGDLVPEITSSNNVYLSSVINDPYSIQLIDLLFDEYEKQSLAYIEVCKCISTILFVHLTRNYLDTSYSMAASQQSEFNTSRFNPVLLYIEQNYIQKISNKTMADMMHLSEDHFSHLFSKHFGVSPQQYIKTIRLHQARELILNGEKNLTEIAQSVGFTSYSLFGRQFKQYFRCTPKEFAEKKAIIK